MHHNSFNPTLPVTNTGSAQSSPSPYSPLAHPRAHLWTGQQSPLLNQLWERCTSSALTQSAHPVPLFYLLPISYLFCFLFFSFISFLHLTIQPPPLQKNPTQSFFPSSSSFFLHLSPSLISFSISFFLSQKSENKHRANPLFPKSGTNCKNFAVCISLEIKNNKT